MTASQAGPVRVMLFARYAELLGTYVLELPSPGPGTVAEVLAAVRRLPGGEALPPHVLCAVNFRQALPADPVRPGDEIALLPPLAGG